MNYAVDRLDRRERFSNPNGYHQQSPNEITSTNTPPQSTLSLDLEKAHSIIHSNALDPKEACSHKNASTSLVLREAHALAGRTLRDGGFCSQALFHFGMAWIYEPDDPMAAGEVNSISVHFNKLLFVLITVVFDFDLFTRVHHLNAKDIIIYDSSQNYIPTSIHHFIPKEIMLK